MPIRELEDPAVRELWEPWRKNMHPWFANPDENRNPNFERERLYEVGPNQQQPEDATPASFTDRIINGVIDLVGARRAEAEIIPTSRASAEALVRASDDPAFAQVIARAHENPRQVHVYAGRDSEWMNGTNIAGLYTGKARDQKHVEQLLDDLKRAKIKYPPETVSTEREQIWLKNFPYPDYSDYPTMPAMTSENVDTRRSAVLAHELGHFLTKGGSEGAADLIANQPGNLPGAVGDWWNANQHLNQEGMAGFDTRYVPEEPVTRMYVDTVRKAMGDRSGDFIGPKRPWVTPENWRFQGPDMPQWIAYRRSHGMPDEERDTRTPAQLKRRYGR